MIIKDIRKVGFFVLFCFPAESDFGIRILLVL